MASSWEYHVCVRRLLPFPLTLLAIALLLAPLGMGQANGAQTMPAAHPMTGAAISPTGPVIPPTGPVRPPTSTVPNANPVRFNPLPTLSGNGPMHRNDGHHHHHSQGDYAFPFLYAVPVPYPVDPDATDNSDADDDEANYQGGPTVFDRRGYGAESYVPPEADSSDGFVARADAGPVVPESPQPPTLLIFKDGHTVELGNYAIVGANLFDLTPGHTRKVALTDIDLAATQRENDDRGVTFALPTTPQAN